LTCIYYKKTTPQGVLLPFTSQLSPKVYAVPFFARRTAKNAFLTRCDSKTINIIAPLNHSITQLDICPLA